MKCSEVCLPLSEYIWIFNYFGYINIPFAILFYIIVFKNLLKIKNN